MNSDQTILANHVIPWSERILRKAHKTFALNPNSKNWNDLVRTMFIHQQAVFAVQSHSIDHAMLTARLIAEPSSDTWGDVISLTTTGMMLHDAVRDVAYTA